MTEQDKGLGGHFVFQSLGKKDRTELFDDFHQKLLAELSNGTTQMIVKLEESKGDVLFGKPLVLGERERPRYARRVQSERINPNSITFDDYSQIEAVGNLRTLGKWVERMIMGSQAEAEELKRIIEQQERDVLIDVAAIRLFEIRDEKTGNVKFGHPEGKKEWIELLPPPYFGVWVKKKEKNVKVT